MHRTPEWVRAINVKDIVILVIIIINNNDDNDNNASFLCVLLKYKILATRIQRFNPCMLPADPTS